MNKKKWVIEEIRNLQKEKEKSLKARIKETENLY